MKKITLLLLFVFATAFSAYAQFPEGFETSVPPPGWTTFRGLNGVGTGSDWTVSTTIFTSGAQSAFVEYENIAPNALAEDWLVTPQFTPTAAANILFFQERQAFTAAYGTQYTIRVSTASQTTISDFAVVDTQVEADFGLGFSAHYVDLSAYNGTPIYVAFVMAQDDGDNWYVDDVDLIGVATAPVCSANPTPADMATNVALSDIDNLLTFSWDAPATGDAADSYIFDFGVATGVYDLSLTTPLPSIEIINLAYSTTYFWRVTPLNSGGSATGCTEWSFTTEDAPPSAANDACSGANAITALPYNFSQTDGTISTNNAGFITACTNGMNDGLWFTFTPATDGTVDITTSNLDADFDPQLDLYSGSCDALVCVINVDDGVDGEGEVITAQAVTAGVQYFINVGHWSAGTNDPEGNFDISVTGTFTLSLDEFENANAFSYFPNPVKNSLSLKAQSNIQNVSIYNMLGQEVLRTAPNTLASDVSMNSLQSGTYFVKVTINDAIETIRVIKQ